VAPRKPLLMEITLLRGPVTPIILSYPDCLMYELDEEGLRKTTYKQTDHYLLTKDFLDDPDYMLKRLFEEE